MKKIVISILRNLLLSLVFGMLIWFPGLAMLLPVTEADDGYGHGPDKGTVEWNNAIQRSTEACERIARNAGVISAAAAFMALTVIMVRRSRWWQEL